ncbi:MAG: hypothetical protein FWC46_04585, partial [Actinomycetia bacterium]|nr:hypothetical protein [Actinomycetes bacterium]
MRGGGGWRPRAIGALAAALGLLAAGCAAGHETIPETPRPTTVATASSVAPVLPVAPTATPMPTPSVTPSPTLDRSRYAMTLTLDPAAKRLSGTVEVTLRNTSTTPWPAVCFRDWAASVLALFGPPGLVSGVSAATDAASG